MLCFPIAITVANLAARLSAFAFRRRLFSLVAFAGSSSKFSLLLLKLFPAMLSPTGLALRGSRDATAIPTPGPACAG